MAVRIVSAAGGLVALVVLGTMLYALPATFSLPRGPRPSRRPPCAPAIRRSPRTTPAAHRRALTGGEKASSCETGMGERGKAAHTSQQVILVCDIHHFSSVALELSDRVPLFIQEFYATMGDAVVSRGGRIISYVGDSILFLFGGHGHLAAVQSALAMRKEFSALLSRFHIGCESELETGIASGEVQVSEIGHSSHRVTGVFGAAADQAWLLGCHRGIAVTSPVKDRIEPHYRTRRISEMPAKWRDKGLSVWEVVESG